MNSCCEIDSTEAIAGLMNLLNISSAVDLTFGNGVFWKESPVKVIGCDLDHGRAKDLVCDFHNLPFADNSLPCVVFDPPFHPHVNSAEETRFKAMGQNDIELRVLFQSGIGEAWRVTKNFLIVKCQGFVHNHKPQWMPLWAIEVCGEPFEWLIVSRSHKRISGRWVSNKSLRRNHADFLVFSKRGNHR